MITEKETGYERNPVSFFFESKDENAYDGFDLNENEDLGRGKGQRECGE